MERIEIGFACRWGGSPFAFSITKKKNKIQQIHEMDITIDEKHSLVERMIYQYAWMFFRSCRRNIFTIKIVHWIRNRGEDAAWNRRNLVKATPFVAPTHKQLACYSLTLLFFLSKWERNKKKKTLEQEHKIFPRHSDFIHKFRVKQFSSLYSTRERWYGVCDFFNKLCSNSNEFRHFISISFRLFRSNSTGFLIMNLFKYANGYFVTTTNPIERWTNDMKYGIHIETCNSCGDHLFTVEQIFSFKKFTSIKWFNGKVKGYQSNFKHNITNDQFSISGRLF